MSIGKAMADRISEFLGKDVLPIKVSPAFFAKIKKGLQWYSEATEVEATDGSIRMGGVEIVSCDPTPSEKMRVIIAIEGPSKTGRSTLAYMIHRALFENGIETSLDLEDHGLEFNSTGELSKLIDVQITTRTLVRFGADDPDEPDESEKESD